MGKWDTFEIRNLGNNIGTIELEYIGNKGSIIKPIKDTYNAFKKALLVFKLDEYKTSKSPYDISYQIVNVIEEGIK